MEFIDVESPSVTKPILIAAMQDMGDIGNLSVQFINKAIGTTPFRYVLTPYPNYVVDRGGYIEFRQERWEYRYSTNLITFGGGLGQPQTNDELYALCKDVINIAKKYSVQLIYTLGAFRTERELGKKPRSLATTTSSALKEKILKLGIETTPPSSVISGFNGLILGFASDANLQGIGLYAEINEPQIPQYRSVKSVLELLEKLTYQKYAGLEELDVMGSAIDNEIDRLRKSGNA
jgi:proteasome assembly chaperone (PAC2) family protein